MAHCLYTVGQSSKLDDTANQALLYSSLLLVSTIHTQDFADVEGDMLSNRVTFPILAPSASRILTALVYPMWGVFLSMQWCLGTVSLLSMAGLSVYLSGRIYRLRTSREDKFSYIIYNVSSSDIGLPNA
jgi:hypothetical protein